MSVGFARLQRKRTDIRNDLTGRRFGLLTVVGLHSQGEGRATRWNVVCDCGAAKNIAASNLTHKNNQSCGSSVHRSGAQSPRWKGHGSISGWWWYNHVVAAANGAKRRILTFGVTIEEAWSLFEQQNGKCALTGLALHIGTSATDRGTASLDRIDSAKGYVPGNVQWVHKDVNLMKNKFDQDYFKELCRLVAAA